MKPFLEQSRYINYDSPLIVSCAAAMFRPEMTETEKARVAYTFVRDEIPHSFDCQATMITAAASEVLRHRTGICHAKANLLAALLRPQGIPTGFCYQHLTLLDDDSRGYVLHCYNAIYLEGRWIKVDARGNRPGVNARFDLDRPVLAYPNRPQYDEYDFEGIYAVPDGPTMQMLERAKMLEDVFSGLPEFPFGRPEIVG